MTAILPTLIFVGVAIVSWVGVAIVRRYAMGRLLDVPNDRSSHARPTPRGGGLALTVAHLLGVLVANWLGLLTSDLAMAIVGGGLVVATVGFLDDHEHVPAFVRLLCHFVAFGWAMWWLGGLPLVDFGRGAVDLGWVGTALMVVCMVWFLNLFNFMDGIDGIAGMQAVTMCIVASLLLVLNGSGREAILPLTLLAAATAGFLVWNWPPAKIFMGDVGSGYLGFALGAMALWTTTIGWLTPWVWLILGGTFLADATVTLAVRARAGAALTDAHRSHAYQRLSRHWGRHSSVTLAYAAVNILWLAPWAAAATLRPTLGVTFAAAALAPLFVVAVRLGAGHPGEIGRRNPNPDLPSMD